MKHLIYIIILLGVVNSASAQDKHMKRGELVAMVNGCPGCVLVAKGDGSPARYVNPDTSVVVMLKIILSNKTSVHFYRKGLKRGDQYWYFDGRRIKKLPGNWFVWEWKRIKQ